MKRFFMFGTLLAASAFNAFATISIDLNSIVNNGDGTFNWIYDASLNADSQLSSGESVPGDPNTTNGFFTIYDVGGFISAAAPNANWEVITGAFGLTSPGVTVNDDAATNVTFKYVGAPFSTVGGSSVDLNTSGQYFIIKSSTDNARMDYVSYRDLNSSGDSADGRSTELVPGAIRQTESPEPSTMGLFGSALAGLAFLIRRRK